MEHHVNAKFTTRTRKMVKMGSHFWSVVEVVVAVVVVMGVVMSDLCVQKGISKFATDASTTQKKGRPTLLNSHHQELTSSTNVKRRQSLICALRSVCAVCVIRVLCQFGQ